MAAAGAHTDGMRRWWSALLGCVVMASVLVTPAPPAAAATGLWQVTDQVGTAKPVIRNNGSAVLTASCGSGKTAVGGWVTSSEPSDLRRLSESFGSSLGSGYSVTVQDQSGLPGTMDVQAHVRCVPTTYFSNHLSIGPTSFPVNDDTQLAEGTLTCPAGWRAMGASVSPSQVSGSTLLTFSPAAPSASVPTAWEFRGYHSNDVSSYSMTVHCVPLSDLSAVRTATKLDNVGWQAGASASCASGMKPLNGGTVHIAGDSGAVTIYPRPTASGWESTTLSLSSGFMQTTVVCVPSAAPTLTISPWYHVTSSRSVSWSFSATDPAGAGGYAISFQCTLLIAGQLSDPAPCVSPQSFTDLPDGYHSIGVVATTSDGRTGTTGSSLLVDTVAPTVAFDDPDGRAHATVTPALGFTVGDATSFVDALTCAVDDGPPGPCGPVVSDYRGHRVFTPSVTTEGPHVVHVSATDQAGNVTTENLPFVIDTAAPTVTMTKPSAPFQLALSTTAAWTSNGTGSAVSEHAVRWRRAPYNGAFGSWTETTVAGATSKSFGPLAPGSTYCYSASARDQAGNSSAWASARCTAVPLDERSLTRTGTWTASTPSGWFRTTALSTTSLGARLSRSGAVVKRVSLTALACRTCGVVGVYVGSTRVGTVNLAASTTQRRTWNLPAFSLRSGTVSLRVLSTGKLVRIDALGISRM